MKVRFIDFGAAYRAIKGEIDSEMQRILDAGDLILRDDVERFEKNLAEYVGTKYAVGVNSGTDALYFALRATGIQPGDEVITVSHTFLATIEAIVRCGAVPILVDVGEDGLMDMGKIIESITSKTKMILPVHLSGKVCDMVKIREIASFLGLLVVEDAAQALGAKYMGKMAGSFGAAGCFSMYPAKILGAYGDAGAITTNDEKIAEKARLLRNHWNVKQTGIEGGQPSAMEWAGNSRLDNLQAAVLNVKLKYLPCSLARRREIAMSYNKGLEGLPLRLPRQQPEQVYQEYIVETEQRNELAKYLAENGVEVLVRDRIPNHKLQGLGLSRYSLPVTERLAEVSVRLPIYPELTDEQTDYVVATIRDFYR